MPLYSYTGKNTKGERVHGAIDAEDVVTAKELLTAQSVTPDEIFQISYDSTISADSLPSKSHTTKPTPPKLYYPITDTLRLYAGWLLAWYGMVYVLGSYQSTRTLSFEIPYLMGIYYSPLVLSFTLGSFLFLLFSGLHRLAGRGIFSGILFSIMGIAVFGLYRMNV